MFCLWNSESLGCGIPNRSAQGIRNPANDLSPEFRFHCQGIQNQQRGTVDSRLADTSLLRRHPAKADKIQPPGETRKEMTEINSRYYVFSLLRKCGHCPQARNFTCFFSRYSGHLSSSSKILTLIT